MYVINNIVIVIIYSLRLASPTVYNSTGKNDETNVYSVMLQGNASKLKRSVEWSRKVRQTAKHDLQRRKKKEKNYGMQQSDKFIAATSSWCQVKW